MARSIGDWYAGRESQSFDFSPDDEYVERQDPWDVPGARVMPARRAPGGANRRGRQQKQSVPRRVPGAAGQPRAATEPKTTKVRQAAKATKANRVSIAAAAQSHPGWGAKRLAASLRAGGVHVTRAQVAGVLSQLPTRASSPRRSAKGRRKRARQPSEGTLTRVHPEESRATAALPYCAACGIRVNLNGMCGCSS